jgi:kynurenine formamidase
MPLTAILALALLAPGPRAPLATADIDESKVVDLTYPFGKETIYWPTARPFEHRKVSWGKTDAGTFYAAAELCASEHGGTHIDAPIHFAEGKRTVDAIPLALLMGPAAVIDVSARAAKDPDYRVSAEDVLAWEAAHGRIRAGMAVLLRTGWGRRWPDRKAYLGTDQPGDTKNLHFPGWSKAAAELLVARRVDLVGLDTPSLDHGPSTDFIVHQVLNGADIPGLENLASLELLPPAGAFLVAAPMKIEGGSGAPTRVFAILP